ncbi:MAG: hypothetical protein V1865_00270 [bacterium]
MKIFGKIIFLGMIITILAACWGCHPNPMNRAYISITNQPSEEEDGGGLGDLNGNTHDYQNVVIDIAGGEMLPERYLEFKSEEGRLRNIATVRQELDSAVLKGDFEKVEKLQFVIDRLNYYGMGGRMTGGFGKRTGGSYLVPVPSNNKPLIPAGIINNSSRVIKISKPYQLAGIELGPGEQTPIQVPIQLGLNEVSYTEYELGKSGSRNRRKNVYVSQDTKNLTISDQ